MSNVVDTKKPSTTKRYQDDELVLNYYDACIYGRDLKLLEDETAWLNDACLHYHLVCLQQHALGHSSMKDVILMDPSVVFCLVQQYDEADEFLQFAAQYQNFQYKRRILVPVNDSLASRRVAPGLGTHWSLLLIVLPKSSSSTSSSTTSSDRFSQHRWDAPKTTTLSLCEYFHFDSIGASCNLSAAQAVARQWDQMWKLLNKSASTSSSSTTTAVRVQECQTPRQRNGYDCGLHVLAAAQVLAEMKPNNDQYEKEMEVILGTALKRNPLFCAGLRVRIANGIRKKAAEQELKK